MKKNQEEKFYPERITALEHEIKIRKKKENIIIILRLLALVIGITGFFYLNKTNIYIAYGVAVSSFLFLIYSVKQQNKIKMELQFFQKKLNVNKRELSILINDFDTLYGGENFIDKEHIFVQDLDIFGKGSLFQILNRTTTFSGMKILSTWLKNPFLKKQDILENQATIKELSQKFEWCQDFCSHASLNQAKLEENELFFKWIKSKNEIINKPIYIILAYALPILSISLLILGLLGYLPIYWFSYSAIVQLVIALLHSKKTNLIQQIIGKKLYYVEGLQAVIKMITQESFNSPKIKNLCSILTKDELSALKEIQKLKFISDAFDSRLNAILVIVLNAIFLYDINLVIRLEKWKQKNHLAFNKWHEVIGEFDALISLALFTFNHPNYTFPEIVENNFFIKAEKLRHPLMNSKKVISNDYEINGVPRIDILTGANMSGKSTFLRTLGVSLVLSMIGCPVSAEKFVFTPVLIYTSLRTNDSLLNNESFFYAELKKLKRLMEMYEANPNVFFLLDEVLKGTNSKDQYLGAKKLIEKLLKINGFGIIATHDVELSKLIEKHPQSIKNIRFEISIIDNKMEFNYKLEEGVSQTMNGTFLLENLGIV